MRCWSACSICCRHPGNKAVVSPRELGRVWRRRGTGRCCRVGITCVSWLQAVLAAVFEHRLDAGTLEGDHPEPGTAAPVDAPTDWRLGCARFTRSGRLVLAASAALLVLVAIQTGSNSTLLLAFLLLGVMALAWS